MNGVVPREASRPCLDTHRGPTTRPGLLISPVCYTQWRQLQVTHLHIWMLYWIPKETAPSYRRDAWFASICAGGLPVNLYYIGWRQAAGRWNVIRITGLGILQKQHNLMRQRLVSLPPMLIFFILIRFFVQNFVCFTLAVAHSGRGSCRKVLNCLPIGRRCTVFNFLRHWSSFKRDLFQKLSRESAVKQTLSSEALSKRQTPVCYEAH